MPCLRDSKALADAAWEGGPEWHSASQAAPHTPPALLDHRDEFSRTEPRDAETYGLPCHQISVWIPLGQLRAVKLSAGDNLLEPWPTPL